MEQIITKDADLLAVEAKAQQRCTGDETPAANTEARIRAILQHPEAQGRWQLALILAIELPDVPTDAVVQILARCPRAPVRKACGDLGRMAEPINTETLVEHTLERTSTSPNEKAPGAAITELEASQQALDERARQVPDFGKMLGISNYDAEIFESVWLVIQEPRDCTSPCSALLESLLQTYRRDGGILTPHSIREDVQRFQEDFDDCRRIYTRMHKAGTAGVRGC